MKRGKPKAAAKKLAAADPLAAAVSSLAKQDATKLTHAEQAARQRVLDAVGKAERGEDLSLSEVALVRRFERELEHQRRWRLYRSVPKRDFLRLVDRQSKIVTDWAKLYQAPVLGPQVDLEEFFRWFGARVAGRLSRIFSEQLTLEDESRQLKLERERFAFERERNEWIPRSDVHELLATVAGRWRRVQEQLQRRFGREAHEMVDEMLEGTIRELESGLANEPEEPR